MTLLFVHSHKFRLIDGSFYSPGGLNNEVLTRYANIFGSVKVIARVIEEKSGSTGYSEITNNDVKILNIKEYNANKLINEITNSDFIITRVPSIIGNKVAFISKRLNKPYLVEVVGCAFDSLWNHSYKGKIIAYPMYILMKNIVRQAPYVLYVSKEFLQKRYPNNGINIGCSDVELPPLSEHIINQRLTKINNMDKNNPIVLGTLAAVNVRYKGQELVIKAISKLNKAGYNYEYHLAGGGDKTFLETVAKKYSISDKIKFLGAVDHEKIFNYLDSIDIYIQPSRVEGLPRALIEAMSRGCPSIGSKTGGIPELLNRDFIFRSGSVESICNILKTMDIMAMKDEAVKNYNIAKKYDKSILDNYRSEFYEDFILSR